MFLAALGWILTRGANIPFGDDWALVPVLAGNEPLSPRWLWSLHQEHRLVLPRLILLALFRAMGVDFRVGMVFNVVTLCILSAAMIHAAGVLRGHVRCSDAFFPLALLHFGHAGNLFVSFQIQMVLSTHLVCAVLLLIVLGAGWNTLRGSLLLGLCLVLLPLCGAVTLVYLPALVLWGGYVGVIQSFSPGGRHRRQGLIILTSAGAGLLLMGLYFADYPQNPLASEPSSLVCWLRAAVLLLTLSIGPHGPSFMPWSGVFVLLVLLASMSLLGVAGLRNQGGDRTRALGLMAFLGGCVAVALAWGIGRGGEPHRVAEPHYPLLAMPVFCCLYYVWLVYGASWGRLLVPTLLFATMTVLLPLQTQWGHDFLQAGPGRLRGFEQDIRNGLPPHVLAVRHKEATLNIAGDHGMFVRLMRQLHTAGIGPFRLLQEDPPFREIVLPLTPSEVSELSWNDGVTRGSGGGSSFTFTLPEPMRVAGIRVRGSHSNGVKALVQVFWKAREEAQFPAEAPYAGWALIGSEQEMTIYVLDELSAFRIHPDCRDFEFRVSEIALLVPER